MITCEGQLGKYELRFVGWLVEYSSAAYNYICAGKTFLE